MNYAKKEKLIYTLLICIVMEFSMAYYNYLFHTDAFLDEAFILACMEFIPAFIVGFTCEWLFISHTAKKIAHYLHHKHLKDINIIHINEFFIVSQMMIIISIFGAIYHFNHETIFTFIALIINDFIKNAVVGIPLFMFVVSPFTRKIVHKIYRNK